MKGLALQKLFDRIWDVYLEMKKEQLQLPIVTFNTLVDACARSCQMVRIPKLLEEMAEHNVTYSAILKGYCHGNRLDEAFQLLNEMKLSKEFHPDEIA